jgi:hypothetical protein
VNITLSFRISSIGLSLIVVSAMHALYLHPIGAYYLPDLLTPISSCHVHPTSSHFIIVSPLHSLLLLSSLPPHSLPPPLPSPSHISLFHSLPFTGETCAERVPLSERVRHHRHLQRHLTVTQHRAGKCIGGRQTGYRFSSRMLVNISVLLLVLRRNNFAFSSQIQTLIERMLNASCLTRNRQMYRGSV